MVPESTPFSHWTRDQYDDAIAAAESAAVKAAIDWMHLDPAAPYRDDEIGLRYWRGLADPKHEWALAAYLGSGLRTEYVCEYEGPLLEASMLCDATRSLRLLKLLLAHGADPDWSGGRLDIRPLEVSIRRGRECAVELLLKAGADPAHCADDGRSMLELASYGGRSVVIAGLVQAALARRRPT